MIWILLGIGLLRPAAACEPVSSGDLRAAIDRAEAAWGQDLPTFDAQVQLARDELLPCLQGPARFDAVAGYHRLMGLAAARETPLAAEPYFRAARSMAASAPPPDPALDAAWQRAAPAGADAGQQLDAPARGQIVVDGQLTREIPLDRPYVFQHVRPNSRPWQTVYVDLGAPPPGYTTRGRALLYGSGGVLALAGVELLAAAATRGRVLNGEFASTAEDAARMDRLVGLNHGLIVGSGVTAGLAVGVFGASIAMGW